MTTSESDAQKALPTFPAERLSSFGVEVLTDLLHLHEDRLPLTVIDECASRGEAIVDALAAMADDPTYWDDDVGAGEWWALFHAVLILGRIPGERAAAALLAFMHRMDATDDDNLQEWLDGCWPALFANKPPETLERLRGFALERSRQWYMRLQALDVVVAAAEREGQATLDAALDWAAALAADETENWDFRLMSAMTVLSFAPPRHRALLEALARRQSRREAAFNIQDIEETYGGEPLPPDWRDRDDPWSFYQPEAIAERQRRWAELEAEEAEDDAAPVAPYVRETPKTGRNDPCPCGSGKKFKHCCMNG